MSPHLPLLLLLLLPLTHSASCGRLCVFRFCTSSSVLLPNAPTIPLPPAAHPFPYHICSARIRRLGLIRSLGPPVLDLSVSPTPRDRVFLSDWRPPSLRKSFPPTFFALTNSPNTPGRQTLLRRRARANQPQLLHSRCVILPVTSWDLLRRNGTVAKTENRPLPNLDDTPLTARPVRRKPRAKERRPCLAFRTSYPLVYISLAWDSPDDLDLAVREPGGFILGKSSLTSAAGSHSGDANVGACGLSQPGVETVTYPISQQGNVREGVYRVTVSHFNNCGGRTKWKLMVVIGEKVVKVRKGRSGKNNGRKITAVKFNFRL